MNRRSRSLSLDRNSSRNRRMSPLGRRASPVRRMSPLGRRASPVRRMSPLGRRASHVRRMSPLGRRASPVRRMSPLGRRASPVDNFSDFESPVSYNVGGNHRELVPFFGSDDEVVENSLESSPVRSNNNNRINRNRHALFRKLSKHRHERML